MQPSELPINTPPTITPQKVVVGILVIISVVVVFMLLNHFRTVIIMVFTGIVISISMSPAIEWLHQHKFSRAFSVILIYLGLVSILLGFIFLILPQMIQQGTVLIPKLQDFYTTIKNGLQNSTYPFIRQLFSFLPSNLSTNLTPASPAAGNNGIGTFSWTLGMAQNILGGFFTLIIVLLLGFYWTLEGKRVEYAFTLLRPPEKRESTRQLIENIENRVGGFIRGQLLLSLIIGVLALIAYLIIGLPSPISLAFLAGLFELVPVFGPTLGAIPALLVTLDYDPSKLLWVLGAIVLIQFSENHFLAPRVMQRTVGVNPIVTILSIVGFGTLFGFPGLLMAIPIAAIFQVLIDRLVLQLDGKKVEAPAGRDRLSKLSYDTQEFVQDVHKLVRKKTAEDGQEDGDEIEDAIESIATDLDQILSQTKNPEGYQ